MFLELYKNRIKVKKYVPESKLLVWEVAPQTYISSRFSDISCLRDVFVEKVYGEIFSGMKVIDVGAFISDSTLYLLLQGAQQVVALEPDLQAFALAESNIRSSPFRDQVTLLPIALGSKAPIGQGTADTSPDPEMETWNLERLLSYLK